MLLLMAAAIAAAALWLGWLQPLLKQRSHWQAELPRLQAQSAALAPLLRAREQQQQAQGQHPTLAGLRQQISAAGLADSLHIETRDGRWHLQVRSVPADALWNWLLPCWPTRPSNCSNCNCNAQGTRTCRRHGFPETS